MSNLRAQRAESPGEGDSHRENEKGAGRGLKKKQETRRGERKGGAHRVGVVVMCGKNGNLRNY